jgi:hypothetical protein
MGHRASQGEVNDVWRWLSPHTRGLAPLDGVREEVFWRRIGKNAKPDALAPTGQVDDADLAILE